MRNVVLVAFVAWFAATSWAQSSKEAKPETLLRWSFVGTTELAGNKNLKVFNSVRALPEAAAMRDAMATNLARAAAERFIVRGQSNTQVKLPNSGQAAVPAAEGTAALIRPLVTDLVQNESRFQMNTQGAQDADWTLAIRLPDDRVKQWGKSLAQLALLSGMKGAAEDKATWVATRDNYKLSFSREKQWTIIQGGYGSPEAKSAKAFRDALGKRNGKSVLDAEINAPLLGRIWSAPSLAHYPKLTLIAEPREGGFHSELLIDYPQDLGIKPEKWNVPTELINDPLIGFTAIQGIQKKLESLEKFKALGAKQTPNQLFLWSQGISPFSVSLAAEVKNPGQVITNAARVVKNVKIPAGDVQLATNRTALLWFGLPVVVPYLEPGREPRSSYITAGLFPVKPHKPEPIPAELVAQLNQKNLVYYDWEITSERIQQWLPIWQLYYLVGSQSTPDNSAPSARFLQTLKTQIGNTITAGTLENPRQIKFTRQSQLGATALELVLLSHYFDSSDLAAGASPRNRRAMPAPPAP